MSKLPVISGSKCVKALEKAGFYFKRQEGSHVTLRRDKPFPSTGEVILLYPVYLRPNNIRNRFFSPGINYANQKRE